MQNFENEQRRVAIYIGLIGFSLPVVLFGSTFLGTCFYVSISHFYFSPIFGAVFVASMATIGTLFVLYRGAYWLENVLSTAIGLCAYGIALFPTKDAGCLAANFSARAFVEFEMANDFPIAQLVTKPNDMSVFEVTPTSNLLHLTCVAAFFLLLVVFILRYFHQRKSALSPAERMRNFIYKCSAFLIVICMVSIPIGPRLIGRSFWNFSNLTFYLEAIAVIALAVSWLVRGLWFERAQARESSH